MPEQIIFSDRNTCKSVISDLKNLWVKSILEQTGLEKISNCYSDSEEWQEQTIEQKALLRKTLHENDIVIIDEDETCIIYVQNEPIAKWEKAEYILKRDFSQIDKSKQMYVEIKIKYSSVFDEIDE